MEHRLQLWEWQARQIAKANGECEDVYTAACKVLQAMPDEQCQNFHMMLGIIVANGWSNTSSDAKDLANKVVDLRVHDIACEVPADNDQSLSTVESVRAALKQPFQGDAAQSLLALLEKTVSSFDPTDHFAPFLPVLQSSGYGKTRAALEMAKHTYVLYLHLGDADKNGYPHPRSRSLTLLLHKTWDKKEQAVEEISQFVLDRWPAKGESVQRYMDRYLNLDRNCYTEEFENSTPPTDMATRVIVVLDEAADQTRTLCLRDGDGVQRQFSRLGLWRAACRELHAYGSIFVAMATTSPFTDIRAMTGHDDSLREAAGSILTPMEPCCGPFLPNFDSTILQSLTTGSLGCELAVNADGALVGTLGRPLWQSFIRMAKSLEMAEQILVVMAKQKLIHTGAGGRFYQQLVTTYCRVPFFLPRLIGPVAVQSYMATAVGFDGSGTCMAQYLSEPALAAGADAAIRSCGFTLEDRFKALTAANSNGIPHPGEIGEVAAAVLLLHCRDLCTNVPVRIAPEFKVWDFLGHLVGEACLWSLDNFCKQHAFTFKKVLEKGTMRFGHFLRLRDSTPIEKALKLCWTRAAALVLEPGHKTVDLLLPVWCDKEWWSIAIQVKNPAKSLSKAELKSYGGAVRAGLPKVAQQGKCLYLAMQFAATQIVPTPEVFSIVEGSCNTVAVNLRSCWNIVPQLTDTEQQAISDFCKIAVGGILPSDIDYFNCVPRKW